MDKKKYRRVNFRISQCTSEDPDYPVSELLLQSPNAKGWQTKRFCQYPQSIVYQLVEPTIIKQISILSHQSKIATKVVIQNKLDINKQWNRLGFLSLQSNVNSNYQARELKTVNIHDKPSLYLRFSFQANYVNTHNIFNQVGVISLCVFGDKMGGDDGQKPGTPNIVDLDKNTLAKLKSLQLQKKQALEQEDYQKAQQIKNQIQRIKNVGKTIMLLQQKKKKAVQNQNYQDAKIINDKIKKLRDADGGGPNFSARPSGTPSDYFRQKKPQYQPQQQEQPAISPQTVVKKPENKATNILPTKKQRSPPKQNNQYQDDDRPINVKNQNPYQNVEDDGPQQNQGQQGNLAPLTKQIKAQCQNYFPVFDEQIFAHLFSANHANRDRGLELVKDELASGGKNKNQTAQAFLYVVKKLIDDKNVTVLLSTLDLFGMGMKKLKPPPGNPFSQFAQQILDKINDYLGHSNQKVRRTTQQLYLNLPNYQLTNKQNCYDSLTKIAKRQKPPKILSGRLKTLSQLVGGFQLGKNYDSVIKYAIKYADDKNSDVRNAAIQLICTISNQIGFASMQPHLKNLRPQIIKSIQQKFHEGGGQDDRNADQRPIHVNKKANQGQKIPIKHRKQSFQQAQNEFIQVPPPKNVTNPQYVCDFCGKFDKKFQNQDYKDLHLYNACPMLMICQQCGQAIEISTYTSHQVGECKNSKYFKKCPRCKEAVSQANYKAHVQKKQCIPAKPLASANRCPLCHLDIDPGKQGWKTHLVEEGCQNNPRK